MSSLCEKIIDDKTDGASILSDSWVELDQSSNGSNGERNLVSCLNGDMERLLREAQREGSTPSNSQSPSNPSSCSNSPPRPGSLCDSTRVSPHVSGSNSPCDHSIVTPLKDILPELPAPDTDVQWVLDWSSKPFNQPPKKNQFRRPKAKKTSLSLRNTDVMKHNIFSWEFLGIFIPSLIVSNLLAFGLGLCIGKRLASAAPRNA